MAVSAEVRRNATLVVAAGGVYFVLQVVLTGFALPLGPYERALFPGLLTEDLWVLRLGMMLLSSLGLILAFRAWVRPAGKAAWAAAGFVAVSWAPVHHGPQIRPEVLLMLGCVAAAGFTTRWLVERDRGALAGSAVAVALAMACDPTVGTALGLALAVVVLAWARAHGGPALIALGAGVLVGWLLASAVRGFLAAGEALLRATTVGATGGPRSVLRVLDPTAAVEPAAVYRALVGAAVILTLVAVGMSWQRWPHRHNAARVGAAVAAALLVAVLSTVGVLTPALLPVMGALAIAVGAGLLATWRTARETGTPLATIAYVVVAVGYAVWQGAVAAAAA